VIIYGSILLTYYLLGQHNLLQDYQRNLEAFRVTMPFIGLLYFVLMYAFGLYNTTRQKLPEVLYTVFLVSLSLMVGTMGICFFLREAAFAFPRSVILLSALLYFVLLSSWRCSLWIMFHRAHGIKRVTVVGSDARQLSEVIDSKYPKLYRVVHTCGEDTRALPAYIRQTDEVFITSGVSRSARAKLFLECAQCDKPVYFVPEYSDLSVMSSSFVKTDDIPTFCVSSMKLTLEERAVKRFFDLLLGGIATLVALPVGLVVALLVKLDGGPIFYSQERLTRDNKRFGVLKFRTMIPDAEKLSGPVLAGENDPRITKIGHFIRAVRLDELPQLINILRGEMSIVGPRPERPFFTEQFNQDIPEYRYRLRVKAGLTGLAQVEGKYNTSVEDKLRYDLIYIHKYSLLRDLLIMLQTVKILFMKSSTEGVTAAQPAEQITAREVNA